MQTCIASMPRERKLPVTRRSTTPNENASQTPPDSVWVWGLENQCFSGPFHPLHRAARAKAAYGSKGDEAAKGAGADGDRRVDVAAAAFDTEIAKVNF